TVAITDPLDGSTLDLQDRSVTLGPIEVAGKKILPARIPYSADIDLRPARQLKVRVSAALDLPPSRTLRWNFVTLDTAGHELPPSSLEGFLPPDSGGS